jgi:hypothetical protein
MRSVVLVLVPLLRSGSLPPQLILGPGRDGTHIANLAISELLLKAGDGQADDLHVVLFWVALMRTCHQFLGDKDVLALADEAIRHPHPRQLCHAAGSQAGLLAQLASCQGFRIHVVRCPGALR